MIKKALETPMSDNVNQDIAISSGRENLFLLRIWPNQKEWQASLKNVDTKETRYFKNLNSLRSFIEKFK